MIGFIFLPTFFYLALSCSVADRCKARFAPLRALRQIDFFLRALCASVSDLGIFSRRTTLARFAIIVLAIGGVEYLPDVASCVA